nr:uncharacterized protein family (UPF0300) [uncultured bacterium]
MPAAMMTTQKRIHAYDRQFDLIIRSRIAAGWIITLTRLRQHNTRLPLASSTWARIEF